MARVIAVPERSVNTMINIVIEFFSCALMVLPHFEFKYLVDNSDRN